MRAFSRLRRHRSIALRLSLSFTQFSRDQLNVVAKFVEALEAFDAKGRKALLRDKSEMGLRLYIQHHLTEIPAAKLKTKLKAPPSEVTPATFVAAMVLTRVRLDPNGNEHVAMLDYTLDAKLTDYVMAVRFDRRGSVVGIEMVS